MMNKNKTRNWLSDFAPAEICQLNDNHTTVQVSFLSSHLRKQDKTIITKTLEIPPRLIDDPLCQALIAYCKSDEFISQSSSTRKSKYKIYRNLFIFLDEQYGKKNITDLTAIYPDYMNHIKAGDNCISSIIAAINVALKWTLEQKSIGPDYMARIKAIQSRIPKISRDYYKPRPALSDLMDSSEYDDAVLIKSLRAFCVVMLKVMREQREYLISSPEVMAAKYSLGELDEDVRYLIEKGTNGSFKVNIEVVQKYFKPIWDAVSSSNSGLLIERMLLNCGYTRTYIQNREKPMTLEDQYELLKYHLNGAGLLRSSIYDLYSRAARKKCILSSAKFQNLSYASLSRPTQVEEALISLLLASERIQTSGQFELSIDDYYITGNTGSWDFSKNRSITKEHPSRIYKVNSIVYQTYLSYIKLCESANMSNLSVGRSLQTTQMRLTFKKGSQNDPFLSVALKGSYLRSWLLNTHPETRPFIDLITNICEHNDPLYNSYGESKQGMKSISLSHVAQSVAISSRRRNIRRKQNAYEKYGRSVVDAALDAHTQAVKQNIYINRSETITRINERKWFSEIVSEEMVTDALNIMATLSSAESKVMSLSDARLILGLKGLKSDSDELSMLGDFIEESSEADCKIGYFGDVTSGSQKIIVEIPIIAALILSYQSALESEFKNGRIYSNRRRTYLLYRYLYVEEILNKFEPSVIEQGNILRTKFDLPLPPIFSEDL